MFPFPVTSFTTIHDSDKYPRTLPPRSKPAARDSLQHFYENGGEPAPRYLLGWRMPFKVLEKYQNCEMLTALSSKADVVGALWKAKYADQLKYTSSPEYIWFNGDVIWFLCGNYSDELTDELTKALDRGLENAGREVLNFPSELDEPYRLKWHFLIVLGVAIMTLFGSFAEV